MSNDWDWESINVVYGEYWLLLGAVLIALVAALVGYALAMSVAHKRFDRWQREYSSAFDDEGRVL